MSIAAYFFGPACFLKITPFLPGFFGLNAGFLAVAGFFAGAELEAVDMDVEAID